MAYDPESKLTEMTQRCIDSIKANSSDYELLIDAEPGGAGPATNRLWKAAKGEYLVTICNDVIIEDPTWLEQLAVPGTITSWHLGKFHVTQEPSIDMAVWCQPRDVQEKIGFIDEQYHKGYGYEDNDYLHRAFLLGIPQVGVPIKIKHEGSVTFKTYYTERQKLDMMQSARDIYFKKWNL